MKLRSRVLDLSRRTHIMGILNVTPDSFSDGGAFFSRQRAVRHGQRMAEEGADIIDIGGESTRPGAYNVAIKEELRRVIPVLRLLRKKISLPISVDTSKAEVARAALEEGAEIINDVCALKGGPAMREVIARYGAAVILMHKRGRPRTMQKKPHYHALMPEIIRYLKGAIRFAVQGGIDPDKIMIDPGIGFGKTVRHNLKILKELRRFKVLGRPIVIGTSRKSFIGKILGAPVGGRLYGGLASYCLAIAGGANILRVHDVRAAVQAARMTDAILGVR